MKKPISKLRSRAGETLAEMLVSLLLAALALTAFATALAVSQRLGEAHAAESEEFRAELEAVLLHDAESRDGRVMLVSPDGKEAVIEVKIYGSRGEDALRIYEKQGGA